MISELLKERENSLIVNGLGGTCWDVASLGDNDLNFYVWGGMGNACMIGLGLALSQPDKKVIVITGDGEMLMGIGSLATIALKQPKNLSIVVFDNELYGETGNQKTHTAYCTNLSIIAILIFVSANPQAKAMPVGPAPIITISNNLVFSFFLFKVILLVPPHGLEPRTY